MVGLGCGLVGEGVGWTWNHEQIDESLQGSGMFTWSACPGVVVSRL